MNWLSMLADMGKIMSGVVAALSVMGAVTRWWRTGSGRWVTWTRNFQKLAPQVRPAYVDQLFWRPAFGLPVHAEEPVYVKSTGQGVDTVGRRAHGADLGSRHRRLLTIWSTDKAVVAFSLTTASRRFAPRSAWVPVGSPTARSTTFGSAGPVWAR